MHTGIQLNNLLFSIGVIALVIVGVIIAASAFVSIFASIRNSRAELAEENSTNNSNNHDDVETEETEEQ